MSNDKINNNNNNELEAVVLYTNRVAKVVKGGKRMKFQAMVVVGDRKGRFGLALAKAGDLKAAIEKATTKAKKSLIKIDIEGSTFPFEIMQKYKASRIFFKPAPPGTGLICSNSIRPILDLAGVKDIYSKLYGTRNKITNAYCVKGALSTFKV
jgi:small subunit ribosomal protein S5